MIERYIVDEISKEKELKSVKLAYYLWIIISPPSCIVLTDIGVKYGKPISYICFIMVVIINVILISYFKYKDRKYLQHINPDKWKPLTNKQLIYYALFITEYLPFTVKYSILWFTVLVMLGIIKFILSANGYVLWIPFVS